MENILNKLEERFSRFSINNLMEKIVTCMALVYVLNFFSTNFLNFSFINFLSFNRAAIMHGQIWRLFTFIFIPEQGSILAVVLSLYLNLVIGKALEEHLGSFKFNVFYFSGVIATIIAGLFSGYAYNNYLNLSMFLAFAIIYPNFELLLFYVLPIKVKYLALLDVIALLMMFINGSFALRFNLIVSLINVIVFCFSSFTKSYNYYRRRKAWNDNFKDL